MFSKFSWLSLITGILFIIAALFMFANPAVPLAILGVLFSVSVLIGGIFALVRYFGVPKSVRTPWDLANAIFTILAGLILVSASASAQATYLPTIVGVWFIVWGIIRMMVGRRLASLYGSGRHLQISGWGPLLLGVAIVLFPVFFGSIAVWLIALSFLVVGLLLVGDFFLALRAQRNPGGRTTDDGIIDVEAK